MLRTPTPVGSTIRYSGSRVLAMVRMEEAKSDFVEQQIHPSVNSQIFKFSCPFRKALSMLVSPYSFSMTTKSRCIFRDISLIKVVFPAPRKPEIINIFIGSPHFTCYSRFTTGLIRSFGLSLIINRASSK